MTRLGSLSVFGNRRFDEAVATVEELRTVLRKLQAVDGRLKDLLNKLQSLVLMFFESRDAERRRFWDRTRLTVVDGREVCSGWARHAIARHSWASCDEGEGVWRSRLSIVSETGDERV